MKSSIALLVCVLVLSTSDTRAQFVKGEVKGQPTRTPLTSADRKYAFMNGNNIAVNIYNYGSIAAGIGLLRHVNNFVWNGLGDFYTAGPVVGAEVQDATGRLVQIVSDNINDVYAGDLNPLNNTLAYGWEPLPGYANPDQGLIATSDNPGSWPWGWTLWPGLTGPGKTLGKKEAFYVMDDRANNEFVYYPFPSDSSRRGLGLEVEGRIFQFDDPDMSDVLFTLYTVKNVSPKPLNKVVAGFYIDVDVGGGTPIDANESRDDLSSLDSADNLVYYWDNDGIGNYGLRTHYTGALMLETPGNPNDGIDNDADGLVDESQTNGIDDDKDWDLASDDVGSDGIPGTGDTGEGDGKPTPGEPNFEMLDREESDEVGLTSFVSWTWSDQHYNLSVDSVTWANMHHGLDPAIPLMTDIVSLTGSGDFPLSAGAVTRFSSAFVAAWDLPGVLQIVDKISDQYDSRLFSGEGGNKSLAMKITAPVESQIVGGHTVINWESSGIVQDRLVDIWYSNTYEKSWTLIAHDLLNNGSYDWNTSSVRDGSWYRLRVVGKKNGNRGFDVSKDFFTVDNPVNGAPDVYILNDFVKSIVSGTIILRWAAEDPERSQIAFRILSSSDGGNSFSPVDSVTNVRQFVLDTRRIPNSYSTVFRLEASDNALTSYTQSKVFALFNEFRQIKDSAITHQSGVGTGIIRPLVVDSTLLTGHTYRVTFDSVSGALRYSITDMNTTGVRISREALSPIVGGGTFCDGFRLGIQNDKLEIDSAGSKFINAPNTNFITRVLNPTIGIMKLVPLDARLVFNAMDTTIDGKYLFPGDTSLNILLQKKIGTPFRIRTLGDDVLMEAIIRDNNANSRWDPGEAIVIRTPLQFRTATNNTLMEIIFNPPSNPNLKLTVIGGETFIAKTKKPFTTADIFEFDARSSNLGPTKAKDLSGQVSIFALEQNYPNPFNPETWIRFSLSQKATTFLRIYDIGGREVRTLLDGPLEEGIHAARWDGRDNNTSPVASGVYFYRLRSGNHVTTKKMLLLR